VVIIAKDASDTIGTTLESLKKFSEVIVYINNSTDNTEQIAQSYLNVKVINGEFLGFGPTKNKAATFSSNDWILSLDSDEVLTDELTEELANLNLKDNNQVFILKRDNYFLRKKIKYSGWGSDYLVRLYNRSSHSFNLKQVHEKIEINKDTHSIKLQNSFKHMAVTNINQFLEKIIKYSDLAAKDAKTCSFSVVIMKSFFAFFKTYILQFGFLDGWMGFVIAVSNANGRFYRYTKRYINCKIK